MSDMNDLDDPDYKSPTREPAADGSTIDNLTSVLDYTFSEDGGPSYTSPLANMMKGIKIYGQGPQMAPFADDTIGLSFVSRPLLNLSDENCSKHMRLATLFKPANNSTQQWVKGLLDRVEGSKMNHDALDNKNGWMCLLMNLTKNSDGFPDIDIDISSTGNGFRGETYQYVDGILDENGKYSLSQTYYNVKGGIVPFIFEIWLQYIYEVKTGDNGVEPYPEAVYQNYIDYDCRVYHLIMEKNMKSISHIFMSIQSIPNQFPAGALASIDNESTNRRGQGQDELSIQYSSVGFRYDSWEVCDGFNGTTTYFNPDMADDKRNNTHTKLKPSEYLTFQYSAYPWVNITTMELEWWVRNSVYQSNNNAYKAPENTPSTVTGNGGSTEL